MAELTSILLTGTDPTSRRGGIGFALPGYLQALDTAGVSWVLIPTHHASMPGGKWKPWLKAFPRLAREIFTARRLGKSVVVYSHAGAGVSLVRVFFILLLSRACGALTIIQLHAPEVHEYLGRPIKRLFFRIMVSPAQALAVLTLWWQKRLAKSGVNKPLFIIPNPLPRKWERRARIHRHLKPDPERIVLLSLTRLVRGKGVDAVIDAMPFLPSEFELIVAGDGPQRPALQRRVQALGMENRVRFTGWVSGGDKQCLFDEADVFVLPTRYDSFGMGFLEAMANGLPVVAAKWDAIPDVVPHGRCGILVKKVEPHALAQAVLALHDLQARRRMGEEGKRWVLEKFSAEVVGREIAAMLQAVAK